MQQIFPYHILVTLDRNYLNILSVMLSSLSQSDPQGDFTIYIANNSLLKEDFDRLSAFLPDFHFVDVKIPADFLQDAPISDRYPKEMYFRLFAARYLPENLDRILYLDPDLVVLNPLRQLYSVSFGDNLFAAASHIESFSFAALNRYRLHLPEEAHYINSGVMMMNLKLLRKEQKEMEVFEFINSHKYSLLLPDQDVLNALYCDKTILIDPLIYNLGEKYLNLHNRKLPKEKRLSLDWVRKNSCVIHYYGRNKPWKSSYHGELGVFYQEFSEKLSQK